MTVYSRILSFRIHHTHGDDDLKSVRTRSISRELMLDENFWTYCKKQVEMTQLNTDSRCRFPGGRLIVLQIVQDLKESAQMSKLMCRAMTRPMNTPMVLYSQLPSPGFDTGHVVPLYIQQKQLRRVICDEIYELMIINRHIQYDEGVLPEDSDFWKLSDIAVEAVNHMHYFLMATNYPINYDL